MNFHNLAKITYQLIGRNSPSKVTPCWVLLRKSPSIIEEISLSSAPLRETGTTLLGNVGERAPSYTIWTTREDEGQRERRDYFTEHLPRGDSLVRV